MMKSQPIKSIFMLVGLIIGLALVWSLMTVTWTIPELDASYVTATRVAEEELTVKYRAEAKAAIELFERTYLSMESHQNPQTMQALTTLPLSEQIAAYTPNDEPFWLVTTEATVEQVRVYEYSPSRLKTTGCVTSTAIETTPQGEFVRTRAPFTKCLVYVFLKEDGEDTWKLATYFNLRDRRDWNWDYVSADTKAIIGELPSPVCDDPLLC